jgi:hypothetical protein
MMNTKIFRLKLLNVNFSLFFFAGVPSNPKTSFDFMEGILNTSESNKDTTETNLSPSVLKKKIENLQSGHQNLKTKR